MALLLKGKKVLITAGPVWVAIDQVRAMTNIFGGRLGYEIAKKAQAEGADVLFLFGPGRVEFTGKEGFKVKKFKYYDDIYAILEEEIKSKKYDIVIQSAAIPDYVPIEIEKGKIKSGKEELVIKFRPTKKIVDQMKRWDPNIFLVKFKLEVNKTKKELIEIAYKSMKHSNADLMVANELMGIKNDHKAYIIDNNKIIKEVTSKKIIAQKIIESINKLLK